MPPRPVISRARRFRQESNAPERRAWETLRQLRDHGYPVRRQYPVGPYVVDFAILRARLVVEIDGSIHRREAVRARDQLRESEIREFGWDVMRVTAAEALSPDHLMARVCGYLGL